VETKYLPFDTGFWQSAVGMFLRSNNRKKDGKDHRYFSMPLSICIRWKWWAAFKLANLPMAWLG